MSLPSIGILGMGYIGQELLRLFSWPVTSWCATRLNVPGSIQGGQSGKVIEFNWADSSTWGNLPDDSVTIVLTIPAIIQNRLEERERIKKWCTWINQFRKGYKRLVYISSTGVYPNQPELWDEESGFEPDTRKGHLRLDTEKTLADHFESRVIRSGAIYGKGRNIGSRILQRKPIPEGNQPVHRIHVSDLAQIVMLAVTSGIFHLSINAVDRDAAPSGTVAKWLMEQDFFKAVFKGSIIYNGGYSSRKHLPLIPDRRINGRRLLDDYAFKFQYPTYKEGLQQAFRK